jgi:DNA-binding transcriptional LysR family regulator
MPSTPSETKNLRYNDVRKWLAVYERAKQGSCETFKTLFESLGPHTTTLGQITQLMEFISDGRPIGTPKLTLESLFHIPAEDRYLRPTHVADELTRLLRGLDPFYTSTKNTIWHALRKREKPTRIRLGCSQTIGLRLLPAMLSNKLPTPGTCELELVIDNSESLYQQLHLGTLDMILSWGPETFRLSKGPSGTLDFQEPDLDVRFVSSGYSSKMVLIASPRGVIRLNNGEDANAGYWNRLYDGSRPPSAEGKGQKGNQADKSGSEKGSQRRPNYEDLDPIHPRDIRFTETSRLIYVPSWNQPEALSNLADDIRQKGFLHDSKFYDEALSLVRMNQGVAAVSEVFLKRSRVVAFRLEPAEWYTRDIGIYYNTRVGLTDVACCLAEFVRHYLKEFERKVRVGEPRSFGDKIFTDGFVDEFVQSRDWTTVALELYPVKT